MTKVELSLFIEANYPATDWSIVRRKPVHGVGTNDADYITTPMVNGGQLWDPAYSSWVNMLKRAYCERYQEKQPTYSDVTVCTKWHSFSAFRDWWLANYREGFGLDKDLLVVGNREYGPDTCICIPSWLNNLTIDHGASRGELPIGVSFCKQTGRYRSQCRNPITGKNHKIGRFTTPDGAHDAWLKYKLALADQLKPEMDSVDKRIYKNVIAIIKAAK